jgi:predicted lipoprotein with Yx(FWY)xxD motif
MSYRWIIGLTVLALVATGCGIAPVSPELIAASQAAVAPAAAAPTEAPKVIVEPTVIVASNDQLGSFLVDAKGMTLYLFKKDAPNVSNCYENCAPNWPPLLVTSAPVAGEGVDAKLLGTTDRKDGSQQLTYNGWPLYYFVEDQQPGDTAGQAVGHVWYVISPSGDQISK